MTNVDTRIQKLEREMNNLRSILSKKTGLGSADVKANIVQPSDVAATIANNTITNRNRGGNCKRGKLIGNSNSNFWLNYSWVETNGE